MGQLTVAGEIFADREFPVQEIEVKVENDHIERLTTAKPILALSELIWNAYDADAPSVRVEFEEGGLTKLALIRIQDNGDGIPFEEAEDFFKSLGGSWKKKGARTNNCRFIHGERGQGRFKAFSLGDTVTWTSSARASDLPLPARDQISRHSRPPMLLRPHRRGCTVEISDVQKDF